MQTEMPRKNPNVFAHTATRQFWTEGQHHVAGTTPAPRGYNGRESLALEMWKCKEYLENFKLDQVYAYCNP